MIRNLTSLFLLATAGLCAQPTIPQISLNVGDALVLDVVFPITAAGPGGPNAVWDFSTSAFSGAEFPYTAQTAASTPYAAQFPNATMALYGDFGFGYSNYAYFDLSNGYTEHGGIFLDSGAVQPRVFSDPKTYFSTPLTASSSGIDSYDLLTNTAFGDLQSSGTLTWTVDGYGTLKLPNATYTNVLRVYGVENETNTILFDGVPMFTSELVRETWWWVKAGIPHPLLVFSVDTEDGESEVTGQAALVSFNGATGIRDLAELPMRVYPNPVRDVVTMELEATGTVQYRVFDALGREVLQGSMAAGGTQRHSIHVAALTAGFYQLEVRSAEGMGTQRLIIE